MGSINRLLPINDAGDVLLTAGHQCELPDNFGYTITPDETQSPATTWQFIDPFGKTSPTYKSFWTINTATGGLATPATSTNKLIIKCITGVVGIIQQPAG